VSEIIEEKKGIDLIVLDMRKVGTFTDYFILCSGTSTRQTQAIADSIREDFKKNNVELYGIEGYNQGSWILMDYIDFIINIFLPETREFYDLERLWEDAEKLEL
jgi:ribosome-associated protein